MRIQDALDAQVVVLLVFGRRSLGLLGAHVQQLARIAILIITGAQLMF